MAQLVQSHNEAQVELAKVRAEGDYVLIKIEMERKAMEKTSLELERVMKQIQIVKATIRDAKLQELPKHVKHLEGQDERVKQTLREKLQVINLLRNNIDETRRQRLDAKSCRDQENMRVKSLEMKAKALQQSIDMLSSRNGSVAIKAMQNEMDMEHQAFLAQKKELYEQLGMKPIEKSMLAARTGIAECQKRRSTSWVKARKKMDLVKRTESLEKKKDLIELLLTKTRIPSVNAFIILYKEQEAKKAALCRAIDQTAAKRTELAQSVQELEREIRRQKGHDIDVAQSNPFSEDMRHELHTLNQRIGARQADIVALDQTLASIAPAIEQLYSITHHSSATISAPWCQSLVAYLSKVEERVSQYVATQIALHCNQVPKEQWQSHVSITRFLALRNGALVDTKLRTTPSTVVNDDDSDDENESAIPIHSKDVFNDLRTKYHAAAVAAAKTARNGAFARRRPRTKSK